MIPIKTEEKIRKLLRVGLSNREIARQTKVSHETVATIRKMLSAVEQVPEVTRKNITCFLRAGLPVGSIEMKFRVTKAAILALHRYYYLHVHKPSVCEESKIPTTLPQSVRHVPYIDTLTANVHGMWHILHDIRDLDKLALITNPLFCHIAMRARVILEKIEGKND